MNRKFKSSVLAITLALSLGAGMIPVQTLNAANNTAVTTGSEDEEYSDYVRIEIKTADDFNGFAQNCYIDSWSKDKYVVLENDIDLSGNDFSTVAVFNGIFDGNSHTISNFNYVGDGYVVGLFRYIESNGVVRNLTLKGNVSSENEEECIGSICGINYGTIYNCTFQGTVSGRDTVGGIAGINESSGIVSRCASNGRVTAYYSTGGIAGINHGDINNCTNRAGINDNDAWVEEDDEMGGVEMVKNLVSSDDNEVYSGVDTGGIVGYSDGIISRCNNYGTVGYEHTGYNIGGIAGRQSGVISLCTNGGTVYGRKDVGGIAGQMEPYIEIDEAESLRNAINKLHDLIEKTLDDMDDSKDILSNDVDTMTSYADSAIDTGDELVDELESFVNDNLDEVNSASERLDHVMDMIPDVLDNVDDAGDAMDRLNDIMDKLLDDLAIMDKLENTPYVETDYNRISLLSTVGGILLSDKTNPDEGDTVTITSEPNDGYELKDIKVTDAKGNKVSIDKVSNKDNKYSFEMPSENVKVEATFGYIGTFLVKSDIGGTVSTKVDGDEYTFTPVASSGYKFVEFTVDGQHRHVSEDDDNKLVLRKEEEITKGKSVTVYAKFEKKSEDMYDVKLKSGTGGTARRSTSQAAKGEDVTITVTQNLNYTLNEVKVTAADGSNVTVRTGSSANERVFKMPASNVNVEVTFSYDGDDDVYVESSVGGTISKSRATGNDYTIRIKPDDGYTISEDNIKINGKKTEQKEESNSDKVENENNTIDKEKKDTKMGEDTDSIDSGNNENQVSEDDNGESETSDDGGSKNKNEDDTNGSENDDDSKNESDGGNSDEGTDNDITTTEGDTDDDFSTRIKTSGPYLSGDVESYDINLEGPDDNGYYTFVFDATGYDKVGIYADFQKEDTSSSDDDETDGTSYDITTVSSTGGTVTTDVTSAKKDDVVYITPTSTTGYVLSKLVVKSGNEDVTYKSENNGKRYSFKMPDGDVEISAQFEPIDIVLTSNLSGNATCSGNSEGIITLTISPDSAYTVESTPSVKDANGNTVSVSKKQSGSYVYEFKESDIKSSPCTVNITFKKQNQKQAIDTSEDEIQDSIDELSDSSADVQDSVKKIRDIVENSDGTIKEWDEISDDEQQQIISEVLNLVDYLGDMSTSAAAILRNLTTIYNVLKPYVSDAANAAKEDIDKATDEVDSMIDSLKKANNNVKAIVNYVNAQPTITFSKLGSDFDETKESFHDQLKGLSDSIRVLSDNVADSSAVINDDLRAVNDQLNVVLNLLADRLVDVEDLSIEELYEEVKDEDIDSITTGRVDICTNKGTIQGDINVGGIAGSMAIDDEDPEDSAAGSIEYEIGRRFITKCLVTQSVNEGFVTAKKDGAGGICGYMNHGIIVDSEGYGSVESTEGDYVGGICGESLTIIRRCYSLASVSGGQNVGGIAGYAQTLTDCYAMCNVEAENGRVGAVAGQVASYEETVDDDSDAPEVSGNFYVNDELYGIDNISYVGVAEPISYNELLEVENLPTEFWHLKVIYKVEDTYLGSEEVKYGEKLDNITFPSIPTKEGYYGVWPDVTDKKMTGTVVVEAEYKDSVTVVQSTGVENEKPIALVEDNFTEDTVLIAKISDFAAPSELAEKEKVVYELSLIDGKVGDDDTFAVRLLNPYDDAKVYGYVDGNWTEIESKVRGQYLQVEMKGAQEYFCIVNDKSGNLVIIIGAVAAAVVLILAIALIKNNISRRKNKKAVQKEEEENE